MFDYARLSQMVANEDKVCFEVVACYGENKLCHAELCFLASELLEQIPEEFRNLSSPSFSNADSTHSLQPSSVVQYPDNPYLAPNPAHNEVTVMGIEPESVSEILVLTMEGRQVSSFSSTHRFNVSGLAPSTYIVRIITKDNRVHYLKLVKQ